MNTGWTESTQQIEARKQKILATKPTAKQPLSYEECWYELRSILLRGLLDKVQELNAKLEAATEANRKACR